jgi:hypothetical protein
MRRRVTIEIDAGETTCINADGVRCPELRVRRFGTIWFCKIWHDQDDRGRIMPIDEVDGRLQRRPECLAAEQRESAIESYAALKAALAALDGASVFTLQWRMDDVKKAIRRWEEEVHCGR